MTAFVRVRVENQPDCTGLAETPDVFIGVADMPSVCKGVTETARNRIKMAGTYISI